MVLRNAISVLTSFLLAGCMMVCLARPSEKQCPRSAPPQCPEKMQKPVCGFPVVELTQKAEPVPPPDAGVGALSVVSATPRISVGRPVDPATSPPRDNLARLRILRI